MTLLKIIKMSHKTKLHFYTKIVAFIIFSWIHQYNYDENTIRKTLENGNNVNISLDMRTHRLLANHEYQNEMPTRGIQYKASYNRDNYKLEKGKGNNNTFQKLKQGRSNYVDDYLKSYKYRYSKKKGLSKLDCYCEKKVLDKIHGLYGIGEKLMNEKKSFKNFFFKKYGLRLILFALIPAVSFIHYILFGAGSFWDGIYMFCGNAAHIDDDSSTGCSFRHKYNWKFYADYIYPALMVFTFTMIIIILLSVFYTLIKVVKYEKLKSGKDKMSLKEYCRFCKDIFI